MLKRIMLFLGVIALIGAVQGSTNYQIGGESINFTNATSMGLLLYGPDQKPLTSQPIGLDISAIVSAGEGSNQYAIWCQNNNGSIVVGFNQQSISVPGSYSTAQGYIITDGNTSTPIMAIGQSQIEAQLNFAIYNMSSQSVTFQNPTSIQLLLYGSPVNGKNPAPLSPSVPINITNLKQCSISCQNSGQLINVNINDSSFTTQTAYPSALGFALTDGVTTSEIMQINSGTLSVIINIVNPYKDTSAIINLADSKDLEVVFYGFDQEPINLSGSQEGTVINIADKSPQAWQAIKDTFEGTYSFSCGQTNNPSWYDCSMTINSTPYTFFIQTPVPIAAFDLNKSSQPVVINTIGSTSNQITGEIINSGLKYYSQSAKVSLSPSSLNLTIYNQNSKTPLVAQPLAIPANGGIYSIKCENSKGAIKISYDNQTITVPGSYPDAWGFAITDETTSSDIVAMNSGTLILDVNYKIYNNNVNYDIVVASGNDYSGVSVVFDGVNKKQVGSTSIPQNYLNNLSNESNLQASYNLSCNYGTSSSVVNCEFTVFGDGGTYPGNFNFASEISEPVYGFAISYPNADPSISAPTASSFANIGSTISGSYYVNF